MPMCLKHWGPSDNFHYPSIYISDTVMSWDHCLFLYFTTQLKDRIKQTLKYDQMLLIPYYS